MNTTRTGKIARLPQSVRNQLGQRLADNQPGPEILAWLNAHPAVQGILRDHFEGRPITGKNLSEWRQGGHQDWLRQQETLAFASHVIGFSDQLTDTEGKTRLSDRFAGILVTEIMKFAHVMLNEDGTTKERWARLSDINLQLSRLRRDDHRATQTAIQQERWSRQSQAEDAAANEAYDQEQRRQRIMPLKLAGVLKSRADHYGGGDLGHDLAALALEYEFNLKPGTLNRKTSTPAEGRVPRVPNIDPSATPDMSATSNPPIQESINPASTTSVAGPSPSGISYPASGISDPAPTNPRSEISNPQLDPAPLPPDAIPLTNDCTEAEFIARSSSRRKKSNARPVHRPVLRPVLHSFSEGGSFSDGGSLGKGGCRPSNRPSSETFHRPKPAFEALKTLVKSQEFQQM